MRCCRASRQQTFVQAAAFVHTGSILSSESGLRACSIDRLKKHLRKKAPANRGGGKVSAMCQATGTGGVLEFLENL